MSNTTLEMKFPQDDPFTSPKISFMKRLKNEDYKDLQLIHSENILEPLEQVDDVNEMNIEKYFDNLDTENNQCNQTSENCRRPTRWF